MTMRMPFILFWAEVEEEEEDENYVFLGVMKTEEEEESSLFLGLRRWRTKLCLLGGDGKEPGKVV